MATKLSAEQIKALNGLKDDEKNDLLSLLVDYDKAEAECQRLRKAQPTESQRVVEKTDWAAMEKAVADKDAAYKQLELKFSTLNLDVNDFSGAFAPIFALFS